MSRSLEERLLRMQIDKDLFLPTVEKYNTMKSQSRILFRHVITLVAVTLLSLRATAALAQQAESQVMTTTTYLVVAVPVRGLVEAEPELAPGVAEPVRGHPRARLAVALRTQT